jgi:hypothetical protein
MISPSASDTRSSSAAGFTLPSALLSRPTSATANAIHSFVLSLRLPQAIQSMNGLRASITQ